MVASIGLGGSSRMGVSMDTGDRIGLLQKQIKSLQKQAQTLQKSLQDVNDPKARVSLIKQIQELDDFIRMLMQQIAMLEQADSMKKMHQQQAAELEKQRDQKVSQLG